MTWNIRHGGGAKGMPVIAMALVEQGADVIVLTEFRTTTGGQIRGVLAEHGWPHQLTSEPGPRTNGILIASRCPIAPATATAGLAADRRWLHARLVDSGMEIAGIHAPCTGPMRERHAFWRMVVRAADAGRHGSFVLIGDFNTSPRGPDDGGQRLPCSNHLRDLSALGYVDAWRRLNPGRSEFSWFMPGLRSGGRPARAPRKSGLSRLVPGEFGVRIDHAWVSAALADRLCRATFLHDQREAGTSDHSCLVVGFD